MSTTWECTAICCIVHFEHTYMYAILDFHAPAKPKTGSFTLVIAHASTLVQIESNYESAHQCYVESEDAGDECT